MIRFLTWLAVAVIVMPLVLVAVILLSFGPSWRDYWYDDELVRRLRTAPLRHSQVHGEDVTTPIIDVFPDGMTADNALRYLGVNGFSCTSIGDALDDRAELACKRVMKGVALICGQTWTIRLFLNRERTLVRRKATLDQVCI
jgi:hypothetical protein